LLFRNLGLFAQDTWRVNHRLSLTYGLRWDIDFVPSSLSGPTLPGVTGFNLNDLSQLALAPAGTSPFRTTYGNVAPRLGAAYQLSQRPDWGNVFRAGFGVFFDLASSEVGNIIEISTYPFSSLVFAPGGTFPLSPAAATPPPITVAGLRGSGTLGAIDPNLKLPYTLQWSGAFEQGLGRQQTLTVSYLGSAGRRLIQSFFVFNPNPNFGSASLVTNSATSNYDALQLQFQRRLSQGLQILASYTWAHSIDTASAGSAFGNSANAGVPGLSSALNRGPSDFDIRDAFSAAVTYDIPTPRINAAAKAIIGGWSLQNIIQARSAPPVEVSDQNLAFQNVLADLRPDVILGHPFYLYGAACSSALQAIGSLSPGQGCPGGKGFNPAAFTDPPTDPVTGFPLRQGNLGRNALRGFGATQWDFAIHRDFTIHESLKLQFRAEMFNVLNHPNFGAPSGAFPFAGFGVASQTLAQSLGGGNLGGGGFDPLYQIGGPRSIQFALKLAF
jgi:hypothetical protein